MQDDSWTDREIEAFVQTISRARFMRYLTSSSNNVRHAFALYRWNSETSQYFYLPLQAWEVALRNRLDAFLSDRYGEHWAVDRGQAFRQLKRNERDQIESALKKLRQGRRPPPTKDGVVARLSAGFWVALLGKGYDVPFAWRNNLYRVFPGGRDRPQTEIRATCDGLLKLRNRIAHHEPIFHLDLIGHHANLGSLLAALCPHAHRYGFADCRFGDLMNRRPPTLQT